METPQVLTNLYLAEVALHSAIVLPYARQPSEERMNLDDAVTDLTWLCYENYFEGDTDVRIPHQDVWLPVLNAVRRMMESFDDRQRLEEALDAWCAAHQAYRGWVGGVDASRIEEWLFNVVRNNPVAPSFDEE